MRFAEFVDEMGGRNAELNGMVDSIDAIRAVLATLAECLPGGLVTEISAQLPPPAAEYLRHDPWQSGERLTVPEFVLRVSQREAVPGPTARGHVQAVLRVLRRSLAPDTFDRVRAELPLAFESLWSLDPAQARMHQPVA